jgi:two-component system sensor histidine kinase KdpD
LIEITNEGDLLRTGDESKIFDRFYRGSQQSAITGVGLGLAICRAIVTMHGGIIWAENVDNEGVKFSFTLPIEGEVPKMEIEEQ